MPVPKDKSYYKELLKVRAEKKAVKQYECKHPLHVTRCSTCNMIICSEKTESNETTITIQL